MEKPPALQRHAAAAAAAVLHRPAIRRSSRPHRRLATRSPATGRNWRSRPEPESEALRRRHCPALWEGRKSAARTASAQVWAVYLSARSNRQRWRFQGPPELSEKKSLKIAVAMSLQKARSCLLPRLPWIKPMNEIFVLKNEGREIRIEFAR